MYAGLTYLGGEKFVGLYGLNETIHDQKAIGLQQLFVDDYKNNLIYTGLSYVKYGDEVYFGDRVKPKAGHPLRQKSNSSNVENNFIFVDSFEYKDFTKTDKVYAFDRHIVFECKIKNTTNEVKEFELGGLLITRNNNNNAVHIENNLAKFIINEKVLYMQGEDATTVRASYDAPSEFMFKGIQNIMYNENVDTTSLESTLPIASSIGKVVTIKPQEEVSYKWIISMGKQVDKEFYGNSEELAKKYWNSWLLESKENDNSINKEASNTALIALKSACIDGLLPADLTGHYFAKGKVCFYVRDAVMASRAFLFSGHYTEFKQIINYLIQRPRKENGEFYQRYNSDGVPDEGANNNVSSQIDIIGYFASVVRDYYILTGEKLVDAKTFVSIVDTLFSTTQKNGLYGPEGGVNEGVYGPAFITSTNMFIAAGLFAAYEYIKDENSEIGDKWLVSAKELVKSIDNTFGDENYHYYGYVEYTDEIVKKYDTPQLFGGSLGYPINEKYRSTFEVLGKIATYFDYGIGYSEQEYHNGPWLFNTCAFAQVAYLVGSEEAFKNTFNWILEHRNDYGLLPEAIDATDERVSMINPLMWANAELVVCCFVERLKMVRDNDII